MTTAAAIAVTSIPNFKAKTARIIVDNARTEVNEIICVTEDDIKTGDYWFLNSPNSS